ncbi:MAG: HD domain-containing protein [Spirochaetia bacterium]|nr:HD domain-containing protein [Spirochaetia bacterium]
MSEKILIAVGPDDQEILLSILSSAKNFIAISEQDVFSLLEKNPGISIVIADPLFLGLESDIFVRLLREKYHYLPILIISDGSFQLDQKRFLTYGIADFLDRPLDPRFIAMKVKVYGCLKLQRSLLERKNFTLLQVSHGRTLEQVHEIILKLFDLDNQSLLSHLKRTSMMMQVVGSHIASLHLPGYELSASFLNGIVETTPLHDIGKACMPLDVLNKPGKLTDMEFEMIKHHVICGAAMLVREKEELLKSSFAFHAALDIILYHHERYDGKGYPFGLKGQEIPLPGRMMAVVDVYDALTSIRPYKKAFTHQESIALLCESRGTHFDPIILDALLQEQDKIEEIAEKQRPTGGIKPFY